MRNDEKEEEEVEVEMEMVEKKCFILTLQS